MRSRRPRGAATSRQEMADARIVAIPDAGHLPWLDRPDTIAATLRGFLQAPTNTRAR